MKRHMFFCGIAALTLLTACGDGGSAEPGPTAAPSETSAASADTGAPDTTAEATTTTTPAPDGPELTEAGDAEVDGAPAEAGDLLEAGAVVVTADLSATLVWADGSITRLAPGTEFAVGTGDGNRGELVAGRAWNRVAEQAAGSNYAIATPDGLTTATGTAYVIACDEFGCTVTVVDGEVDVEGLPLTAAQATTLTDETPGEPTPVNWDMAFGDPWVLESADADEAAGYPTGVELAEALGPRFASLDGVLLASNTVLVNTTPDPGELGVGAVFQREYTFQLDCSAGYPCIGQAVTTWGAGTSAGRSSEVVPIVFDGTTATWEVEFTTTDGCDNTATRVTHLVWTLTPTAAEVIDGRSVVVDGTGTIDGEYEVTDFGACEFDPAWALTEMHSEMDITGRV